MRELSPAYPVVEVEEGPEGARLLLRDLRSRNIGARFGEIRLRVDPSGSVRDLDFRV